MAGLLKRLGRGLAAGMSSYGQSMLDQQRQDRLEQLKRDGMDLQKAEGEADRAARKAEGDANRQNALDIAKIRASRPTGSRSTAAGTFKNVKWLTEPDGDGNEIETGNFIGQDPDTKKWYQWDKATNTFTELGGGIEEPKEDPQAKIKFEDAAKSFGKTFANNQASTLLPDMWDFSDYPEGYQSEEKVGKLINEALLTFYREFGADAAQKTLEEWSNLASPEDMRLELESYLRWKKTRK